MKLSEQVKSYTEIRNAADELLNYVAFPSLSDLIDAKISVSNALSSNKAEDARVTELLLGSNEPLPLFDDMVAILEDAGFNQASVPTISRTQESPGLQYAYIDPVPQGTSPYLDEKKISLVYHAANGKVDVSSSLSDISAAFCNLIPPIEMSLCVPYFDVRIIYPQDTSGVGKLSPLRFVGILPNSTGVTGDGSSSSPDESVSGYEADAYESLEKIGFDVAGMEIFCMPQTLAASSEILNSAEAIQQRGVKILEPMMPLLTLESANIQQTGVGGTLYAQTKVELRMVLHDRSRLSEIEAITSPEVFPTATFRITFGWTHPENNKMTGNVYAKLLNSMKVKQDFAVTSISISSRDATSLSIGVTLISLGSQVAKGAKIMTANGNLVPYSAIQTLLKQYVMIKNQSVKTSDNTQITPFQKVGSTIIASTSQGTSRDMFIKIKDFYDFYALMLEIIQENAFLTDDSKIDKIIDSLKAVDLDLGASVTDTEFGSVLNFGPANLTSAEETGRTSIVYDQPNDSNFFGSGKIQMPQDLITRITDIADETGIGFNVWESKPTLVPLASAVARLVAKPILLTQPDITEVRIHCFSFNSAAGRMAEENIGNFPILLTDLGDKVVDGKVVSKGITQRTSAESILSAMLKQLNDPASFFYGHNTQFVNRKSKVDKISASAAGSTIDPGAVSEQIAQAESEAQDLIDKNNEKILTEKDIGFVDGAFVPPRIKSQIDVLPAFTLGSKSDPSKKIARILIYDDRAGGFNKLGNLVFSMINTNGIGRMSNSRYSIPDDYDIDNVEELFSAVETDSDGLTTFALASKERFREIVANMYPTITVGTDSTCVLNATFSSQPAGEATSSYLLTALQGGGTSAIEGAGTANSMIDDVLILPSSVTLTMLGNVCITRGQTYYIDFNTGTTLDNAYTVQSVTHSIRPGVFTTTAALVPVNSASMRSIYRQAEELKKIIKSTAPTIKQIWL